MYGPFYRARESSSCKKAAGKRTQGDFLSISLHPFYRKGRLRHTTRKQSKKVWFTATLEGSLFSAYHGANKKKEVKLHPSSLELLPHQPASLSRAEREVGT
jgi:hypothetical protein